MVGLFNPNRTFNTGGFKCVSCAHETMIFIRNDYTLFNCMVGDKPCSNCHEVKNTLSDGDLIMRYDWPDSDDNPWQVQSAFMLDQDRYCEDCKAVVRKDWKKLVVTCSRCDGYMVFIDDNEPKNSNIN